MPNTARIVFGLLLLAVACSAWNIAPGAPSISHALGTHTALPLGRGTCGRSNGTAKKMMAETSGSGQAKLRPVILCPAQFGTSSDYDDLKADLKERGFDLYPAPLRRFDWVSKPV